MSDSIMANLNIVHLIHSGGFYGAERMLLDHCLVMPGNHRVMFIDAPAALLIRFQDAGVSCHNCSGLSDLLGHLRRQPGLLNAHNFKAQVYAWICASLLNRPLVLTQHGFTPRSTKQKLYTWISLRLCRSSRVRRVACVAQSIARFHLRAGVAANKVEVIPNGLPERKEDIESLSEPDLRHDAPMVGFVGRLSGEKGPDLFLDALIALCQQRPQLRAVLLGDGPLSSQLRARVFDAGLQTRILLPGYQDRMHDWMKRLSVLAISSRTEGTPMILLEAMQSGTAVAAFAVGGIPDVIQHYHNGLLAHAQDSAGLARCIALLLDDPALRQRLTESARQAQREHYHLPVLAKCWRELYQLAAQVKPT